MDGGMERVVAQSSAVRASPTNTAEAALQSQDDVWAMPLKSNVAHSRANATAERAALSALRSTSSTEQARPRSANAAQTDPNPELAALFTHLRPLDDFVRDFSRPTKKVYFVSSTTIAT